LKKQCALQKRWKLQELQAESLKFLRSKYAVKAQ